ncbi:unnamed protein product [Durusdinium trenchii]|uniref:Cationic amino acid transporter C-terminal domain-containing protein n=1 Tax=Durusdinium trenchii TaxID=1381693 RepID=A0ABP0R6Y1_9DINO
MHSLTNVLKRASRTKPIPEEEEDGGLRRCLKTRDVVGLGMGVTVGAGVFMATGKASEEAGPAVVIALLIAAFGCGCTGLCYAEMANLAPSTGSSYSFVYHSAGELPACMVGLTNIINNVMTGAAVSRGWEGYLRALLVTVGAPVPQFLEGFAFGPFEISFLAPLLLGFVIAINLCGTLAVSTFNNVVTVGSITMLLIYVFGGAANVDPDNWDPFMPTGVSGVAHAAGSVFFSYIGFDVLATLSTEATHSRVIPLGIVLTLALSTCLYCCVGGVFTGLIKYTDISKTAPLASAAELRGLRWLALLVAIGALGNTLTTVIGCVLAQPRLCFAMAQDGLLPSNLVRVNRFGAPARSLLVLSVPALFFALVFDFHKIADVVSVGALCIFSLVCASLILLRCPRALHATGGNSAGAAASHSSNDEEPVRPSMPATRSPRRVIVGLVTFSISIFVLGILFRIPSSSTLAVWLLRGSMAVVILSAAISVFFVCLPFLQSREDTYTWAEQTKRAHGFKLPFMPVPPLIGIMMNVLLISQMSFLTLMEALFLQTVAGAFYFGYSFSRSHLNVTKKTWAPVFASTVPPQEPDDL